MSQLVLDNGLRVKVTEQDKIRCYFHRIRIPRFIFRHLPAWTRWNNELEADIGRRLSI